MVRLQLAGISPEYHAHTHAHSHTHLHLHPGQQAAAAAAAAAAADSSASASSPSVYPLGCKYLLQMSQIMNVLLDKLFLF